MNVLNDRELALSDVEADPKSCTCFQDDPEIRYIFAKWASLPIDIRNGILSIIQAIDNKDGYEDRNAAKDF